MNKSATFTTKERMLLAQLIKDHNIVENKKTDGATLHEKNEAWDRICIAYNAQPEVDFPRTQVQLRKLWNNLKQKKRKETTALRHSFLATGGGPPLKAQKIDPVLKMVEDAAPDCDIYINYSWDSTATFEKEDAVARSIPEEEAAENTRLPPLVDYKKHLPLFTLPAEEASVFCPSTSTAREPGPSQQRALAVKVLDEEGGTLVQKTTELSGETLPFVSTSTAAEPTSSEQQDIHVAVKALKEKDGRVKKPNNSISHQQELHQLRKMVIEEDLGRAKYYSRVAELEVSRIEGEKRRIKLAVETAEIDLERAEIDRQRAELDLRRAADEAELAELKLQQFKREFSEDQ